MEIIYPKLRDDLIIVEQDYSHQKLSVIKNPVTKKMFRVKEVESAILKFFDGNHNSADIHQLMLEQYNMDVPIDIINNFIKELERFSLIDGGEVIGLKKKRHAFPRINPLFIKVFSFNPNSFLDLSISKLKFIFSFPLIVTYFSLVFVGFLITATNWKSIYIQISNLFTSKLFYSPENILLIYIIIFITSFFHESIHALCCKYFGRDVPEMGFALFFLLPAFFTNTTETWLLKERSKRLWVSFAGVLSEMVIWSSSLIVWFFTPKSGSINMIFFLIMITSGAKAVFNLIPLIKLDGYYAFCEFFDIPNLRGKSFRYLLSFFLKKYRKESISKREKIIYISYGIPAIIFTLFFIIYIIFLSYKTGQFFRNQIITKL